MCEFFVEHRCYAVLVVVVDRGGGGFAEGDSGAHEWRSWCLHHTAELRVIR